VWSGKVIVTKELAEDDLQVPDTEEEAVVEQLAPQCTDPALGEGVRSRSPERKPDDPHGFVLEDLVDEEEQWRRVQARCLTDAATTFEMTKADLERWRQIFQPPDATELETADIDPPPEGFDSWEAWVAQ
jgi:hypothetical protein